MIPWWAAVGFVWVVVIGVGLGILAAHAHAKYLDRLQGARMPLASKPVGLLA